MPSHRWLPNRVTREGSRNAQPAAKDTKIEGAISFEMAAKDTVLEASNKSRASRPKTQRSKAQ